MSSFFTLSEQYTSKMASMMRQAIANNNEFEIRFGKFYQTSTTEKKKNFDSNMDIEDFYKLKKQMNSYVDKKNIINKNTQEFIYKDQNNNSVKRIIDIDTGKVSFMSKKSKYIQDIYDYDLRMAISEEINNVTPITDDSYEIVRNKQRTSYIFEYGRLDLTIVSQVSGATVKNKYEVEFEITKMDMNNVLGMITVILQVRQDNFYVISNYEKQGVIYQYKDIVKTSYFVGGQPETLQKEQISNLYKELYSVTDKADGDRAFLIIDKNKNIYFMDNNLNKILKTNVKSSSYYSCIIDGEIVKNQGKIYFLAFDLLAFNNQDLRGNKEYTLKPRLDRLNHIVDTLSTSDFYLISCKKYYYKNVFLGSKILLNEADTKFYKNDGLIFTPMNEPYPLKKQWRSLLKWKPAELNSIDFYAIKTHSDNNTGHWQLYVQGEVRTTETSGVPQRRGNQTQTVLFDIEKLCGETNLEKEIKTYQTTFDDNLIDETTGEPYSSNTVIEFSWDKKLLKFVPLRTRWDKTINPKKHGNFSTVACSIWNNINNPIEKELLFRFSVNTENGDFFFERMRRFHNQIKDYLYNKYCKNTKKMLELCSGRGGDLHKWVYNEILKVDGYDISEKNINECKKRFNNLKNKKNMDYNFYKMDLTKSECYETIYKNNPDNFNVVCCQFGIHYFFESEKTVENIINTLDKNLENNGYFIITFLDDQKIDNLFNNKNFCYSEENGEILYVIERENNDKSQLYGNKLKISLNGNNILGEGSEEWIINFENFKNLMKTKGYECVETDLFEKLYDSNLLNSKFLQCEIDISFLNRYCVFKKNNSGLNSEPLELPIQYIDTITNIKTEFNFEIIDLQQKDISVYKITSLYDILDILNCIEYRYYKNKIKNELLENENTFQQISKLFTILNINFNPVYIKDLLDFNEYLPNDNSIYFTYNKHSIEKKSLETDINEESIEYNNWYIVMHNTQLLFNIHKIIQNNINVIYENVNEKVDEIVNEKVDEIVNEKVDEIVNEKVDEIVNEKVDEIVNEKVDNKVDDKVDEIVNEKVDNNVNNKVDNKVDEIVNEKVDEIVNEKVDNKELIKGEYELNKSNDKLTIKLLKDLLQRLDIKTSGKKQELQNRLEQHLYKSF